MELIKKAIKREELHIFLAGLKNYKVEGNNDLSEPNDFIKSWDSEILPYIKANSKVDFHSLLKNAIKNLLKLKEDPNLGIYTIMSTLNWLYFYKSEGKIEFNINLEELSPLIIEKFRERKTSLKQDKRWAGAEWNSPDGLWSPLVNTAKYIKENYKGIDLLPQT